MIKIEKGIPIPGPAGALDTFVSVLRKMEIGDSLVLPYDKANSIYAFGRSLGVKFAVRKISAGSARVWRIA